MTLEHTPHQCNRAASKPDALDMELSTVRMLRLHHDGLDVVVLLQQWRGRGDVRGKEGENRNGCSGKTVIWAEALRVERNDRQ